MKTHSLDNYLDLIQNLLDCSQGDEGRLLQQSEELINPELLQVMESAIEELANDGNFESANYLRYWQTQLARLLQQATTVSPPETDGKTRAYLDLIGALLHCPEGSGSELLAVNEDLIDPGLVQMMKQMAVQTAERGDRETANYLNNLATEIEKNWLKASLFSLQRSNNSKQTSLGVEDVVSSEDPWTQANIASRTETKQDRSSQQDERDLNDESIDRFNSYIDTSANDSLATSFFKNSTTRSNQSETSNNQNIEERLAAIAQSLAKLEEIIVTRLQPVDPLWYMDVLERASASHWTLSTEEVEKLIGVKPKCEPGKNSYQRGCWLFVKASKMGAQTGWHVIKQIEDFSL
ncbi:MAG: hypothetical protein ACRC2R_27060 [Xenococcaceae cyanobacterium]